MSDFRFCSLQQVYVFQLRHLHTWHTRHTRHSTPRFLGSILNLPPPAAAALTPWPRIGETRTNRSALLWVPSSLLLARALSSCSGHGTLIVPQWPSAYFWPFLHDSSSQFKSFVNRVFELPCIEDLLLGRSWLEANLQGASLGFQWFPEIQNVSLAGRFSVSLCHPCLPCTSLSFQLYSSPCHCWSFSLASLWFAWFGSVDLVVSFWSFDLRLFCTKRPFAWFGIVVLTVRVMG